MIIRQGRESRLEVAHVVTEHNLRSIQADRAKIVFTRSHVPPRGVEARSGILKKVWLALVISCFCGGNSLLFAAAPKGVGQSQQIVTQAVNQDGDGVGCVDNGSGNCGNTSGGGGGSPCLSRIAQPGYPRAWEAAINVAPFTTVNAVNRNLHIAIPIVSWSGLGPDMSMTLYYNSADADASPTRAAQLRNSMGFDLGPGWRTSYSDTLIATSPTTMTVVAEDGTQGTFTLVNGIWQASPGIFDQLVTVQISGGTVYRLLHKDQSFHEFDDAGKLIRIVDVGKFALTSFPTGKALTITRETGPFGPNGETTDRIKTMTGAAGRRVSFIYGSANRLNVIVDENDGGIVGETGFQRAWTITYDASNRVSGILDPASAGYVIPVTYEASSNRINSIAGRRAVSMTDPPLPYTFTYNPLYPNAVATVTDPLSMNQSFGTTCNSSGQLSTTYTDRRQAAWVYRATLDVEDPARQNGPIFEIVNPLSKTQRLGFNSASYLLESYTDELGQTGTLTYDSRGNLLTATDPVGAAAGYSQVWAYDSTFNNLLTYTDGEGNTVTMLYEDTSYPTKVTKIIEPATQPGGSTADTSLSYYPSVGCTPGYVCNAGQIKRIVDPNGVVTEFEYDGFGQLSKYTEGEDPANPGFSYYRQFTTYDEATRPILTSADNGSVLAAVATSGSQNWSDINQPTGKSCTGPSCQLGACEISQPLAACGSSLFPDVPPGPDIPKLHCGLNFIPRDEFGRVSLLPYNLLSNDPNATSKFQVFSFTYDDLGFIRSKTIESNEYDSLNNQTRAFSYDPNLLTGLITRTGPDNSETLIQFDIAARLESYTRKQAGANSILLDSSFSYFDNGLVKMISYGNGSVTGYTYDAASRVTVIDHRTQASPGGLSNLKLEYSYDRRNLPTQILESSETGLVAPTTTVYSYDARGRLIAESRSTPNTNGIAYDLEYDYDAGGNRTEKRDLINNRRVVYTYDFTDPVLYGSANNRLRLYKTQQLDGTLLSTTYYFYNDVGNPTNIVTKNEFPGTGVPQFSGIRFGYANNSQTVAFIFGETWDTDAVTMCPVNHTITFARQFGHYDARQRYVVRELDPVALLQTGNLVTIRETWSDYDGNDIYSDYTVENGVVTVSTLYEPGIGQVQAPNAPAQASKYLQNDLTGTVRSVSDSQGNIGSMRVFTAFGEPVSSNVDRFGYIGAFGYQATIITEAQNPADAFPYLHVGARYYDSAAGRFLQRDPIGIFGGSNVYEYVNNNPVALIDPSGLGPLDWLYTGYWDPPAGVYDAAVEAAGSYLNKKSPVRGGYVGIGTTTNGGKIGTIGAAGGVAWTIDSGTSVYGGAGYQISRRGSTPGMKGFFSATGAFGYGGSYGESGGSGGGYYAGGLNQKGKGGHYGASTDGTVNFGISYGPLQCGLVIDLSRLFGS